MSIAARVLATALMLLQGACVTSKVEFKRSGKTQLQLARGESLVVLSRRQHGDHETEASFRRCIEDGLTQSNISVVPEGEFVDALYPWFEPRTAPLSAEGFSRMLEDPVIESRVEQTGVKYMIWVDGETDTVDSGGQVSCFFSPAGGGCFGLSWMERESEYGATLWDVDKRRNVGSISADATGTTYMPAFFVPVPFAARTRVAACKALTEQLNEFFSGAPVKLPANPE